MAPIGEAIGMAVGISTILTFLFTKLWDAQRMEKKYRTIEQAEECMKERAKAESSIIKVLRRMERRMALGNLVMRDLIKASPEVENTIIEQYEKDLGITLSNRDFGIPEDI